MKISEVTLNNVMDFLKIDADSLDMESYNLVAGEVKDVIMPAAIGDIKSFTGLTLSELDEREDITIAYLIKCQEYYDNRSINEKEVFENKAASSILNRYRQNLV